MDYDDQPSSERDLASMAPMRNVEYNYDDNEIEMDAVIDGMNASPHLPPPDNEPNESAEKNMLDRFLREEISYDEYMRLIGGQTVEEELQAGHLEDEEEEEEEEEEDSMDETCDEDEYPTSSNERAEGETIAAEYAEPKPKSSGLPAHVRNLMEEIVNDELSSSKAALSDALPTPRPHTQEREKVSRKLSKTMDALLGQANLIYARGNTKEALTMLLEVIRQEPRNAYAYQQVSDIYGELGDQEKSLQYGLLAAHLDNRTPADTWARWGIVSKELNLLEEAAACYGRAIKSEPQNWMHYERRIEILDLLGLRPLAMRTRLQAAQLISHSDAGLDFEWFHSLIKDVAQYYIMINDEDRAILALEAFVLRSKEFGKSADAQHETLIGMWMAKNRYIEAGKSILALCEGIRLACDRKEGEPPVTIRLSNGTYSVDPFPPSDDVEFVVDSRLSTITLTRLIVCFIGIDKRELASKLKDILLTRNLSNKSEEAYILDVARAYYNAEAFRTCRHFLEQLQDWHNLYENDEFWFIYGNTLSTLKDEGSMEAFERSLQINPSHVDARINLSTLQQKAGLTERALETLQGYDLDTCTHLPDERLLIRQADVLLEQKKTEQFVRCVRMLLTPHFYEIHRQPDLLHKRRQSRTAAGVHLSNTLRVVAMNTIQNSNLEKFVKRLGSIAAKEGRSTDDIDVTLLHDYCLNLIECYMNMERYQDMLIVCCYAFLQPRLNRFNKSADFQNILYFAAIKANSWALAFEYVRWYHTMMNSNTGLGAVTNNRDILFKRIFNAMNYVFCHSQNVSYHRYIMRALAKAADNNALQTISGNNSLITGTYRHALGEYLRVWHSNKNNPLICLLLALTFTHMSCKKDLSSRHMIAVKGIGFMKLYQKKRKCQQEVYYNIGRMFHQMSITPLAIHFYKKVLEEPAPIIALVDEEGNEQMQRLARYDLTKLAAHNLALIYKSSGNDYLARRVYEQYVVV